MCVCVCECVCECVCVCVCVPGMLVSAPFVQPFAYVPWKLACLVVRGECTASLRGASPDSDKGRGKETGTPCSWPGTPVYVCLCVVCVVGLSFAGFKF